MNARLIIGAIVLCWICVNAILVSWTADSGVREIWKDGDLTRRGFVPRVYRDESGAAHRYVLFVPYDLAADSSPPVLLFLNGQGENGADGVAHVRGPLGSQIWSMRQRFPFVTVFPQCDFNDSWTAGSVSSRRALAILDRTLEEYHADPDRVYLTGVSSGGGGVWSIGAAEASRFAAIAPVAAAASDSSLERLAEARMPIWCFYVRDDPQCQSARTCMRKLIEQGSSPLQSAVPGVLHDAWTYAYSNTALFQWLLRHRRQYDPVATRPFELITANDSRSGWHEQSGSWRVSGNDIEAESGTLSSAEEYLDFEIHFEFRLAQGRPFLITLGLLFLTTTGFAANPTRSPVADAIWQAWKSREARFETVEIAWNDSVGGRDRWSGYQAAMQPGSAQSNRPENRLLIHRDRLRFESIRFWHSAAAEWGRSPWSTHPIVPVDIDGPPGASDRNIFDALLALQFSAGTPVQREPRKCTFIVDDRLMSVQFEQGMSAYADRFLFREFDSESHLFRTLENSLILPVTLHFRPLSAKLGGIVPDRCTVESSDVFVNGRQCLVVTEARPGNLTRRLWVDPDRSYVIVRIADIDQGRVGFQHDIEYEQVAEHDWLPQSWTTVQRGTLKETRTPGFPGETWAHQFLSAKVKETNVNVRLPGDAFVHESVPEVFVVDYDTQERYLLRSDGTRIPVQPGDGRPQSYAVLLNGPRNPAVWKWLADPLVSLPALAVLLTILIVRRLRLRAGSRSR